MKIRQDHSVFLPESGVDRSLPPTTVIAETEVHHESNYAQHDLKPLIAFLDEYAGQMPRTMLRSSIEKLAAPQRQFYLKK